MQDNQNHLKTFRSNSNEVIFKAEYQKKISYKGVKKWSWWIPTFVNN